MRVLTAHRSILTTRNVTLKHVPSAAPAPPQQLPPIAGEGESIAREGASGEGASSQGGGRVEDLYSESNLDMTEVWRPVPPATREAPAAKPGAGAEEVRKATPQHHRSPPGGPNSVVSTAAVEAAAATTAASAVTVATAATTRIFPRLWEDLRVLASSPHCKVDARGPSGGAS